MKPKKKVSASAARMPDDVVDAWARYFIDITGQRRRGELPSLDELDAADREASGKAADPKRKVTR